MQKDILAIQFQSDLNNIETNFKKVDSMFCPCDILVLPEVWSVGWFCEDFNSKAEDESGLTLEFLKNFARSKNVNIIGGSYIRKTSSGLKNSMPVISRKGEVTTFYDKVHLFAPDGEDCLTPGNKPLSIEIEGVKIGLSICYDIRFPEFYRSFENMPHLLINASAWPKTRQRHYEILSCARAIENQAYFLGISQTGRIKNSVYNAGNSLFVDPFGDIIQKLNEDENYIFARIDAEYVEKIREKFPNLKVRKRVSVYEIS